MPRVTLDAKSLFDPLVIEMGDRIYTSVPRSPQLVEKTEELRRMVESKQITLIDNIARTLALVFGADTEEFRVLDMAILNAFMDAVNNYLEGKLGNRPAPGAEPPQPGSETAAVSGSAASPASPESSPGSSGTPIS